MYILIPSAQDIQSGIITALRTFLMHLCESIYKLIIFCFNIFEGFGNIRLFENSDVIAGIYNRIGLILGLFMIFRISFSAIEYIINPDNILDKSKGIGNIVKRVIIVIVLLGSTRFLFDFAYDVQEKLIDSKIVSKVILSESTVSSNADSGANIAWYAFSSFYQINPDFTEEQIASDSSLKRCNDMLKDGSGPIYTNFHNRHSLSVAYYCLNQETTNEYTSIDNPDSHKENVIEFNGVFCLAVGIFLLWTIFTYTVQAGVRIIQLAYLELIAPIPIMLYLTPNGDDKLTNWGKQCLTTFLDFFIRLAIMDFIIIVSQSLIELRDNIFGYFSENSVGTFGSAYIIIILIIALMIFAKRIPNLLQEILPSMGGAGSLGFGFGVTGETKKVGGFLGGLAGGAIGATAGGAINAGVSAIDNARAAGRIGRNRLGAAMHGLGSGALIGIRNGARGGNVFHNFGAGMAARRDADRNYEQLLAEGGSARGRIASQVSSHFGLTRGQEYERMRSNANHMDEYVNNIQSAIDRIDAVRDARAAYEHFTPGGQYATRDEALREYRRLRTMYTNHALGNTDINNLTDEHGNSVNITERDLLHLTEARQQGTAANRFAESVHARYIDVNGEQHDFTRITDETTLGNVGFQANSTETMITGSEDYIRATANDRAAGVNSNNNNNN